MAEDEADGEKMEVLSGELARNLLNRFVSKNNLSIGLEDGVEEIELSLGLSSNGRFGVDPIATALGRSSSISDSFLENPKMEDPPAVSVSRTSSLPPDGEEWRKRKKLQSMRRMEAKRKRTEKQRNSSQSSMASQGSGTSGISGEGPVEAEGKEGNGGWRNALDDMPCVSATGDGPNGKRVEGFLYRYRKGEEVRIVCVCHGSFLSPAEFVKHAGCSDVAHPLRHIIVNTSFL